MNPRRQNEGEKHKGEKLASCEYLLGEPERCREPACSREKKQSLDSKYTEMKTLLQEHRRVCIKLA